MRNFCIAKFFQSLVLFGCNSLFIIFLSVFDKKYATLFFLRFDDHILWPLTIIYLMMGATGTCGNILVCHVILRLPFLILENLSFDVIFWISQERLDENVDQLFLVQSRGGWYCHPVNGWGHKQHFSCHLLVQLDNEIWVWSWLSEISWRRCKNWQQRTRIIFSDEAVILFWWWQTFSTEDD